LCSLTTKGNQNESIFRGSRCSCFRNGLRLYVCLWLTG